VGENKMSEFNKKEQKVLAGLSASLEAFFMTYNEMTALQMRCFVIVARRGKVTGKEIAVALDISGSNVSRCVAILSDITMARRKAKPLDLVKLTNDPLDRRVRYVELTEKGKAFALSLTSNF